MNPIVRPHRILLVDDVIENIQVAGTILKQNGYHLNIARNGKQALQIVEKTPPDLILLDVIMPVMDGLECCRNLKANPQTQRIPVVFLTSNTQTDDMVKGFAEGASDYICKPFNATELLTRIHTHLALRATQQRLEDLTRKVSRYVSPHVCEAIFSGEKSTGRDTQEKPLTVFFSDVVQFSKRTERMGDKDLTAWLNGYCAEMAQICIRHGGTLDKFIGDAVMVFFGDPKSNGKSEDAIACVSMAVEMNQAAGDFGIQIRTGMNSGQCFVGDFGADQHMNYTVIGGVVNIAARLQSNSEPGKILISEATYELVKDAFWCELRGPIKVKGIEQEIVTYWVN